MPHILNARMEDSEMARFNALQARLQKRADPYIRITQRLTILKALDALERRLDELDADRERKR